MCLRELLNEPNAACVVRACDERLATTSTRSAPRLRTRAADNRHQRHDVGAANLGVVREQRAGYQEPGGSKGVLALEDPLGRAEGVAHSWLD